jgi:hypothetical protein
MNPQRQKKSWKKEILIKEVMLIIYLVGWAKGTGGINF